jgi:hypothetical protein
MNDRPASATAALVIMSYWEWRRCDPDGVPFHPGKDLSWVVNRLALEGLDKPEEAVLALLCRGELIARGDYRWQKYQRGNFYKLEGSNEILKPLRWEQLADIIADDSFELAGKGWPISNVDLKMLGWMECPVYEWEFGENRFCTAICPPDTETYAPTYVEEWYSAWDIEVWPNDLEPIIWDDDPEPDAVQSAPNTNKGGRPPAADWEAAALEIAGRYYRGDFKPQTIADVARELASWLGEQDLHPSDSIVRVHAKRIFDAFQAWERE